ncbi:hypothetical protein ACFTWM_03125 [Streptomyces bacillaris]|uniref:hypothetical protein n=1 Tax=Streptomyces bacillaris TaxID=68179 RepID=UPI003637AE65
MKNSSVMNSHNAVCVIVHDGADTIAAVLYSARGAIRELMAQLNRSDSALA